MAAGKLPAGMIATGVAIAVAVDPLLDVVCTAIDVCGQVTAPIPVPNHGRPPRPSLREAGSAVEETPAKETEGRSGQRMTAWP
jgi:Na+/H+-dicarboxylate symporter